MGSFGSSGSSILYLRFLFYLQTELVVQSYHRIVVKLYLSNVVGAGAVEPLDRVATLWYTHCGETGSAD